jgi:nucleoside-diphosphate-sugar epimerase
MNIYLTGATGFLGKAIAAGLLREDHRVTALLLPGDDASLVPGCTVERGDVTDEKTLAGTLTGHDAVVHLAGAVGYGQTWATCLRLNRDGTDIVAGEAVRSGVRRFVHMSSVSVYGRVPDVHIPEDFPLKKIGDPYGDTKIDAENRLRERERGGKLDLTIIRPTMIYGPGDALFLPKVVENLTGGLMRIIGTGENTVNLIHVRDVADFVCRVLHEERSVGGVYNLTHPENPSWKAFLCGIATDLGVPPPDKHIPYRAALVVAGMMELASRLTGKPPRLTRYAVRNVGRQYTYLTDRMRKELGFIPSVDTVEGIRTCVRNLTRQGDKEP